MLRVYEIFRSIQGEGVRMGIPTTFVRLVGCNLRCRWCDTAYAYEGGRDMTTEDILERVHAFGVREVCITGGEPLRQDVRSLLEDLLEMGHSVVLETNGSLPIRDLMLDGVIISMDWKLPSSGEDGAMLGENLERLRPSDQLKFVVADTDDLERAVGIIGTRDIQASVVFQPVGGRHLEWLVEAVLERGINVRVLPQLHKIIWGEERGV